MIRKLTYFLTGGTALGRGYRLLGALGFETSLVYAHRLSVTTPPRLTEVSQVDFDGFSGFAHELKTVGALTSQSFPARAERRAAFLPWRWLRRCLQLPRVVRSFFGASQGWRELPRKVAAPVTVWKFFSVEETDTMRQAAKAAGISLQTHLLFHLNDVIKPRLTPSDFPARWALVMSFHPNGAVPCGIQSATVEVAVRSTETPSSLHAVLQKMGRRETYWGMILLALATSFLPRSIYRALLAKTYAVKQRVGTFMNLGLWIGGERIPEEAWAAVPPVNAGRPLGAGAIEFNGKLGLGLKLDPSVGLDATDGGFLLDRWGEAALAWRWN